MRELVTAHEGTIIAQSPGANLSSTFVVTLPRAQEKSNQLP